MVERQPAVDLRDHPVPVDQNVEGDDGRDDQKREEAEHRGAAGHEPAQSVDEPLRALGDEVADRFLNLVGGELIAETELVEPGPQVFLGQRHALVERQRLKAHGVAGKLLGEGDELVAEDRRDHDEDERKRGGERHENDQRRAEAVEPQFLELADQRVEEVAERDSRGERRDGRTEQVQADSRAPPRGRPRTGSGARRSRRSSHAGGSAARIG